MIKDGCIPFATTNENKIREIESVLAHPITVVKGLSIPEVQCKGFALEDVLFVAGEKAKAAWLANDRNPVIVEDSSLCIDCLEGRPGPLVDQFASTHESREALCRSMPAGSSRSAIAYCVLSVFDGFEVQYRVGQIAGYIADAPRGTNGFGWDDIFIPDDPLTTVGGKERTFAEMGAEEKDSISMRRRALEAMKENPFARKVSDECFFVSIDKPLMESFKGFISTPIDTEYRKSLEEKYSEYYDTFRKSLQQKGKETLQAAGFFPLTSSYDHLAGKPVLIPRPFVVNALIDRHICLEIFSHDALLEAQRKLQSRGYIPVKEKEIDVIEKAIAKKRSVTFADYALGVKQPELSVTVDSARALIAEGLFSYTANDLVTLPFLMSSMPDVVSAWSLATMAIAGGIGFIPVDSIWSDPQNQKCMADETFRLIEDEPALKGNRNDQVLIQRARDLVGATLKANPRDAVARVKLLRDAGVRTYRVYDPRDRNALFDTVHALRDNFGSDIRIFAGQVVSGSGTEIPFEAERLVAAGANSLIVGIGEGGICSTPTVASLAPDNIKTGYVIARAGVGAPVLFDGGVGTRITIAFAVGAAGVLKSRLLVGIEGPGTLWAYPMNGRYARNYSGEAAARTKSLGGKTDRRARPFAVEGIDQYVTVQPAAPSTASIIYDLLQGLATSLIFARASSLEELQHQKSPLLLYMGARAGGTADVHHPVA